MFLTACGGGGGGSSPSGSHAGDSGSVVTAGPITAVPPGSIAAGASGPVEISPVDLPTTPVVAAVVALPAIATPAPSPILLWSDPATWGGRKPVAGAAVLVPSNMKIVLDENTPALGDLTIEGEL